MKSSTVRPPALGRLLLRLLPLGERREEIADDLATLFEKRFQQEGRWTARRRYVVDALSLWKVCDVGRPLVMSGGLGTVGQDVRYASRLFLRRPALFSVTVAGLGVAIGISTAVFTVVQAVAFTGYGFKAPESVFRVALTGGTFTRVTGNSAFQGNWAFSDYSELQKTASTMDVVASLRDSAAFSASPDQATSEHVPVMAVSDNYFGVLGMRAAYGRVLTADDARSGASVVVVNHGFWRNRLGADPSVVGRTIRLGELPFTVIGVASKAHSAPGAAGQPPAFWTTFAANRHAWVTAFATNREEILSKLRALTRSKTASESERARLKELEDNLRPAPSRWNPAVDVLGRLRPHITRAHAEGEVAAIAAAAITAREPNGTRRPTIELQRLDEVDADAWALAAIVMTTVGFVVLLACANVTNVLLANAATRRREIGTRLAVGASRGRVIRQLLTESVLLGLAGGVFGLLMAFAMLPSFAAIIRLPSTFDHTLDISAYAFVGFLAVVVGVMAGLAPARYGWRGDLMSPLKSGLNPAPSAIGGGFIRSLLISAQASISIVLLVLAALLTRSLVQSTTLNLSYDVTRVLNVSVANGADGRAWTTLEQETYLDAVLERVRQVPGVAAASLATIPPFSDATATQRLSGRRIHRAETSPDYFSTLGIALARGRIYTADEVRAQAPVAVISESLARAFWGTEDPIGAPLERVWGTETSTQTRSGLLRRPPGTRVIGVVANAITTLQEKNAPTIYLPLGRDSVPRVVVRAEQDARAIANPVRDAIDAIDPRVSPVTMLAQDGLQRELEGPKILASVSVIVGTVALGLAVIGLFGVTAFVVEQRLHEVSVRRVLGATDEALLRMLLRDSLRPVMWGLAVGLLLSLAGGRIIESALYGISGRDPIAILIAIATLLTASVAAIVIPSRRAAAVSPARILQMD
jgi:putative ABC transport system permease protein